MRSEQHFLAELCISFVYYVKSTLDQAKSDLSTLGASSPSNVLSLAADLTLCSLTFSNDEYLPVLTQLYWCKNFGLMFPQNRFSTRSVFSSQPGRAVGEKQCFSACSPTWDPKMEQHNNQMGGTNRAFENLEGAFVSNSAFKRGKRPRAFIFCSNPFSHPYLRLKQKWPTLSPADGLAIKHAAAHTWHCSVRASQPPKSRSHFYFLGAGMREWVEGPGYEQPPQMFHKKEVNL